MKRVLTIILCISMIFLATSCGTNHNFNIKEEISKISINNNVDKKNKFIFFKETNDKCILKGNSIENSITMVEFLENNLNFYYPEYEWVTIEKTNGYGSICGKNKSDIICITIHDKEASVKGVHLINNILFCSDVDSLQTIYNMTIKDAFYYRMIKDDSIASNLIIIYYQNLTISIGSTKKLDDMFKILEINEQEIENSSKDLIYPKFEIEFDYKIDKGKLINSFDKNSIKYNYNDMVSKYLLNGNIELFYYDKNSIMATDSINGSIFCIKFFDNNKSNVIDEFADIDNGIVITFSNAVCYMSSDIWVNIIED